MCLKVLLNGYTDRLDGPSKYSVCGDLFGFVEQAYGPVLCVRLHFPFAVSYVGLLNGHMDRRVRPVVSEYSICGDYMNYIKFVERAYAPC